MKEVTKEDFFDYFNYLSAGIDDDKYFEHLLIGVFDIVIDSNIANKRAGKCKIKFIFGETNPICYVADRPDYDPKVGYLQDFHRGLLSGKGVTEAAPFGTETANVKGRQSEYFSLLICN